MPYRASLSRSLLALPSCRLLQLLAVFSLICTQRSPILHVAAARCCDSPLMVVVVVVAYAGDYKKAAPRAREPVPVPVPERQTCLATWPICMCRTRRGGRCQRRPQRGVRRGTQRLGQVELLGGLNAAGPHCLSVCLAISQLSHWY